MRFVAAEARRYNVDTMSLDKHVARIFDDQEPQSVFPGRGHSSGVLPLSR